MSQSLTVHVVIPRRLNIHDSEPSPNLRTNPALLINPSSVPTAEQNVVIVLYGIRLYPTPIELSLPAECHK